MSIIDRISLQLYSVNDETQKDFIGTIKKVAAMGYKGVEFAGFFGTPAAELRSVLDGLGLKSVASHTSMELLKNNLAEVIEYNKKIGTDHIICPWWKLESYEDCRSTAHFFNEAAKMISSEGMKLGYHNHEHEFRLIDGRYALDLLLEMTDPELFTLQADVYWVEYAGVDPIQYIKKHGSRCKVLHLKDMNSKPEKGQTEVGNGIINIKGIIEEGMNVGTQWFTVEQEEFKNSSLEGVQAGLENIKKMFQ